MKRMIAIFLTLLLIAAMLPASVAEQTLNVAKGEEPTARESARVIMVELKEPTEPVEIWDGSIATGYAGGSGTEADPYLIANGAQLAYLAQCVNTGEYYSNGKYFKLTADIYLNDTTNWQNWANSAPANKWTAIGRMEERDDPPMGFLGHFDGDSYSVSGVYINKTGKTDSDCSQGLFGYCYEASIVNLAVKDSYIRGYSYVGSVVGASTYSDVSNCYNTGTVIGNNYVGGLAGDNSDSVIENCYNTGRVSGNQNVGGLAGASWCIVENCYNKGAVSGSRNVGGIVGYSGSYSGVENCYNIGKVSGSQYVGGVIGYNYKDNYDSYLSAIAKNCYYLDTCGATSGTGYSGGIITNVIALTDAQLRVQSNYVGFDFDIVWTMDGSPDYPYAELTALSDTSSVSVTEITATETLELGIAGTAAIAYTVFPIDAKNQAVTFASNDEAIATVDSNGVVTGVSIGTTTITTTTEDGGFTARTAVTVHPDCTVTYTVDGVTLAQYTVHWNDRLKTIPSVPAREGYFGDWSISLRGTAITENKIVSAVYTPIPDVFLFGDADVNGTVEALDAAAILRHVVKLDDLTGLGKYQGDVTEEFNGEPDASDAAAVLRWVVLLIDTFPVEG
ncbi:MAG: GLUG motif-containing protein [Clostridia bacterium]|nr:GLUG motif-containing protein [Clostridia bacterium]